MNAITELPSIARKFYSTHKLEIDPVLISGTLLFAGRNVMKIEYLQALPGYSNLLIPIAIGVTQFALSMLNQYIKAKEEEVGNNWIKEKEFYTLAGKLILISHKEVLTIVISSLIGGFSFPFTATFFLLRNLTACTMNLALNVPRKILLPQQSK